MNPHRHTLGAALAVATAVAIACSAAKTNDASGGPGGATAVFAPPPADRGQLAVELVDAPAEVEELVVNVAAVTAHAVPGGWTTLTTTAPGQIDLLKLQDPANALPLGFANLPAGTITQIRLLVAKEGNHVTVGGTPFDLEVPSGYESGIKIQGPWEVTTCSQTAVTLDFDGHKSIWYHPTGHGDEWILRPVIHAKRSRTAPVACGEGGDGGELAPPAAACDAAHPCADGRVCVAGACAGGTGARCAAAAECASGVCVEHRCGGGGFGAPCTAARDCLSGACGAGTCSVGAAGDPCRAATDCVSGACKGDGSCADGGAGGFGAPCKVATDCLSNVCSSETSTCDGGDQGKGCTASADCATGLVCNAGSCTALPPQ